MGHDLCFARRLKCSYAFTFLPVDFVVVVVGGEVVVDVVVGGVVVVVVVVDRVVLVVRLVVLGVVGTFVTCGVVLVLLLAASQFNLNPGLEPASSE